MLRQNMMLDKSKVFYKTVSRNINTLEYPMWSPSYTKEAKNYIENERYVLYAENFILPSSKDIDILNRLLRLSQINNTDRLEFDSIYDLGKELGFFLNRERKQITNGKDYLRIKESLDRWQRTFIGYDHSFYSQGKRVSRSDTSIIIEKNLIQERGSRKDVYIRFNDSFLSMHNDKFAIDIPILVFEEIKNPYAKRLAEILFKSFRAEDNKGVIKPFYMQYETVAKKIPLQKYMKPVLIKKLVTDSIISINFILKKYNYKKQFTVEVEEKESYIKMQDVLKFVQKGC